MERNVFSLRRKEVVDRSSFSCVGSLFHARGAATEKAVSPIRRRVRGTTRSPDDEARSADRAGTSEPMSVSLGCTAACVQEATCGPSDTAYAYNHYFATYFNATLR